MTSTKDPNEIVNSWLFMADQHYLSARLLFMHSLYPVAMHISATSLEMYVKCLLQLKGHDHKITHNLRKGLDDLGIKRDLEIEQFLADLEKSYKDDKYPDNWAEDVYWKDELDILDNTVVIIRNEIHKNTSDRSKVQDLLKIVQNKGFLMPNISEFYGVLPQKDIFLRSNRHWTKFNKF
ncbi:MAG: HEPN domain-containing protein [Candidatus Gracilibacteria bacterium]|jgi:HEPN domain-containing protein|nr:HEPN domain-containing protein [Candidatus Gracilibacteria bacterium]